MDWLTIVAIVFSIIAFIFSYKWAQDSDRSLQEVRRVAEDIKRDVEHRTKEIEKVVERRTEKIEQAVSERTANIERIVDGKIERIERMLEERLRDLIDRAAPKAEDKAYGDMLSQYGGQIFMEAMKDPELLRTLMVAGNKSGK